MKGSDRIIELLNDVLTAELTAVNQYWVHARMCENWGYSKLWQQVRTEAIDEMKHADQVVARVLYLDSLSHVLSKRSRCGLRPAGQTASTRNEECTIQLEQSICLQHTRAADEFFHEVVGQVSFFFAEELRHT